MSSTAVEVWQVCVVVWLAILDVKGGERSKRALNSSHNHQKSPVMLVNLAESDLSFRTFFDSFPPLEDRIGIQTLSAEPVHHE